VFKKGKAHLGEKKAISARGEGRRLRMRRGRRVGGRRRLAGKRGLGQRENDLRRAEKSQGGGKRPPSRGEMTRTSVRELGQKRKGGHGHMGSWWWRGSGRLSRGRRRKKNHQGEKEKGPVRPFRKKKKKKNAP